MAGLTIKVTSINKRKNSTGYVFPSIHFANHTYNNVFLKEGTSILKPTFIVERPDAAALPKFNFLYCEDFLRYYWVLDTRTCSGKNKSSGYFVEIDCEVDVLASWKATIGTTPCFIKYCSDLKAKDMNNDQLVNLCLDDDRLSAEIPFNTTKIGIFNANEDNPFYYVPEYPEGATVPSSVFNGSFIVKMGKMGAGSTANYTHVMSPTAFGSFVYSIYKDGQFGNVTDFDGFIKWMCDKAGGVMLEPDQFISSIIFVPISYDKFTAIQSPEDAKVGTIDLYYWSMTEDPHNPGHFVPTRGSKLQTVQILGGADLGKFYWWSDENTQIVVDNLGGDDPDPQPGDPVCKIPFLKRKKYTKVILKTPGGELDLSTDSFGYLDYFVVHEKILVDMLTGNYLISVFDFNTGEFLGKIHGDCSYRFDQLFTGGGHMAGAISGITSLLGGAASFGASLIGAPATKKDVITRETGTGLKLTGKAMSSFGSNIQSSGCNSGTINTGTNQWLDFYDQCWYYEDDGHGHTIWKFHPESVFYYLSSGFIPQVCKTETEYQHYADYYGYPVEKYVDSITAAKIAEYSFVQCANFNVKCGEQVVIFPPSTVNVSCMLPEEAEEINNYLNTGIYWETDPRVPVEPGE